MSRLSFCILRLPRTSALRLRRESALTRDPDLILLLSEEGFFAREHQTLVERRFDQFLFHF